MNDDEFINVGNNRCSSLNIVLKNEGILGGPHSAHEHFTLTWLFFKLSRLKKVESNVSVKPSHDVHLHSQYVPILPYSSRSYMQLADTIRDTGVFSWQESCKRSTNRKNGTVGRTSRGVQEQWADGKRLVQGKSES